jgi:hypothetical protein
LKLDISGATTGHGLIVIAFPFHAAAGQGLARRQGRQVLPTPQRFLRSESDGITTGHGLIVMLLTSLPLAELFLIKGKRLEQSK